MPLSIADIVLALGSAVPYIFHSLWFFGEVSHSLSDIEGPHELAYGLGTNHDGGRYEQFARNDFIGLYFEEAGNWQGKLIPFRS